MTDSAATKWDQRPNNPNAVWIKTRSLVGQTFTLVRAAKASVKGRPSYVFELNDGRLFSANETSTIGKQIARSGVPPAGEYTIATAPSETSPTKDALVLRAA